MFILIFTFLVILVTLFIQAKRTKEDRSLPPIAPGYLPIVGHLFSLFRPVPIHQLFTEWSKSVGPIYTCHFGYQTWIVLNSFETIKDLICDRGTIYSSRNLPETFTEGFFQGEKAGAFAFFKYGKAWRDLRKIAHVGLVKSKIDSYQPILDNRRTILLSHLLKTNPQPTHQLLEYYSITSIMSIAFGSICSFDVADPVLYQVFSLTEELAKAVGPADQLRQFFPILHRFWPDHQDRYRPLRERFCRFYGDLLDQVRLRFEQGQLEECFMKDILISRTLTDLQIIYFVGMFVGAGSDTTATTIEWIMAYLANHPEVQEKAFQEISTVVGTERLPTAKDESQLPYLYCIIMEVLRLRPPAPISIPHTNTQDDLYGSWFIPKNTVIIMNLFCANHDPERYPDPHLFKPERHLAHLSHQKQTFSQSVDDRPHLSFSTGRRVCVGIHLAERSLFMAVSMLIASFRIERPSSDLLDLDKVRDITNTVLAPVHYDLNLIPRHNHLSDFILD